MLLDYTSQEGSLVHFLLSTQWTRGRHFQKKVSQPLSWERLREIGNHMHSSYINRKAYVSTERDNKRPEAD